MKLTLVNTTDEALAIKTATEIGLNLIDFDNLYSLYKIGAKVKSEMGYPDEMTALNGGFFKIVVYPDGSGMLCVLLGETIRDYFKTSPVVSCTVIDNGFKIETQNSHYELRLTK